MKSVFTIIIVISLIGCHSKAIPTIPTRTIDPPPPVATFINTVADPRAGLLVFNARCNRCHDLPDPLKYNSERWETILRIMIPRARLSSEESNNVTAYVKEHSGK